MATITNEDKMLYAVLSDEALIQFGRYKLSDVEPIYQAIYSDNCVISTVARIIHRTGEGASERELWKEINDYLKKNV